ncbi:MAG: DUF805 domain-containing protein [Novosphingobium sp.]|nr:DUF805 domain-containing protein [Novosphingobium sp.]
MLEAIKYGLANLANFSGRDARQAFWYYVLFLFILNMVVTLLMVIPMFVTIFAAAFEGAQAGMSEEEMTLQMTSQMAVGMGSTVWVSLGTNLVIALLLAASFVRRLHDSDHSGWWAALAFAAQMVAALFSINQIERMQQMMATSMNPEDMTAYIESQQGLMAYGLLGWIAPIIVIIFGVMKSTEGPNRYGDTSFTA